MHKAVVQIMKGGYERLLGLARTIYIRSIYGIFGREITNNTVIYGAYIRSWPALEIIYVRHGPLNLPAHMNSHKLSHTHTHTHTHTHENLTPAAAAPPGSPRCLAAHPLQGSVLRALPDENTGRHESVASLQDQQLCSIHATTPAPPLRIA